MNKFNHISEYLTLLIDDKNQIEKAAIIITGILKARIPRLNDISREMNGKEDANYKCIQRFLKESDPKSILLSLFQDNAKFVIGDPTEMPRPGAKKTDYVGKLSDGQTKGYWLLFLATPYQGRAIPCHFVSYSSRTINDEATSRNRYHFQAFAKFKELQRVLNKVFYMGKVFVNEIGWWQEGFIDPMWIMTNLPAEQGLEIYLQRMKIEESFRDLKNLLGLEKMKNKKRESMEKMVVWVLIAYAISLIVGEILRNQVFPEQSRKRKLFSGPFLFIKLKLNLLPNEFQNSAAQALVSLRSIVFPVRSFVWTSGNIYSQEGCQFTLIISKKGRYSFLCFLGSKPLISIRCTEKPRWFCENRFRCG